jgi:DNA-binding Xre family transcriptional regulator
MKVIYDKLFDKLRRENINQKELKKINIGGTTMNRLRTNQSITTDTICKICEFLHCMPDEIMEWIPDSDFEKANEERKQIETQILELQKKLKNV